MEPSCAIALAPTAQPRHGIRLAPINGLRGIAILGVLYAHLSAGIWSFGELPLWLSPLLTNTATGVNLFFILSGFVLFLPYVANAQAMGSTADRIDFYRRRALRLLPLFYVAVAMQWTFAALDGTSDAREFFSVVAFAFTFDARHFGPSFNFPLWSIGVEVVFSALFPFLALASRKTGMLRLVVGVLAAAWRCG